MQLNIHFGDSVKDFTNYRETYFSMWIAHKTDALKKANLQKTNPYFKIIFSNRTGRKIGKYLILQLFAVGY